MNLTNMLFYKPKMKYDMWLLYCLVIVLSIAVFDDTAV